MYDYILRAYDGKYELYRWGWDREMAELTLRGDAIRVSSRIFCLGGEDCVQRSIVCEACKVFEPIFEYIHWKKSMDFHMFRTSGNVLEGPFFHTFP